MFASTTRVLAGAYEAHDRNASVPVGECGQGQVHRPCNSSSECMREPVRQNIKLNELGLLSSLATDISILELNDCKVVAWVPLGESNLKDSLRLCICSTQTPRVPGEHSLAMLAFARVVCLAVSGAAISPWRRPWGRLWARTSRGWLWRRGQRWCSCSGCGRPTYTPCNSCERLTLTCVHSSTV
jgi:hypothetical protein